MPQMPTCMPKPFEMGKDYSGKPYEPEDSARCVYCGRFFTVTAEMINPNGKIMVPVHVYPTKSEIREWRRTGVARR